MYAPVVSKINDSENIFIERVLPVTGSVTIKEGQKVFPYDHLGYCDYSQKSVRFSKDLHPVNFKSDGEFYSYNEVIGKLDGKKIAAPYNGNLKKLDDKTYIFSEENKKYSLLSGVWGTVSAIIKDQSVLIKSKSRDLKFAVTTNTTFSGELIVFPNPGRLLERFYLDEFTSGFAAGKIVYVGNHISTNLLKDAVKYGVGAVIGGSADVDTYQSAVKAGMSMGLFSGFGDMPTPEDIFTALNEVSSRFIFFQGERRVLRIPLPSDTSIDSIVPKIAGPLAQVIKGMKILLLQQPNFGRTGIVDSVGESSIFVKFSGAENLYEVKLPNFVILA